MGPRSLVGLQAESLGLVGSMALVDDTTTMNTGSPKSHDDLWRRRVDINFSVYHR